MDYEYLGDALEDAIKALEFALNKSQREPMGMCFNDVGRSIETIEEMKEQIEILEEAIKRYRGRDEVQKLAEAKAEGRLVELPPDGQIYHIEKIEKTEETWVGNKPCRYITADGYYCGWGLAAICFPFSELGKTAFLTREEAEKALGEV